MKKDLTFEIFVEGELGWSHDGKILLGMVDTLHANIVSLEEQVVKLDY
jgi:hypothetical protein